jgi:hypothetical protein
MAEHFWILAIRIKLFGENHNSVAVTYQKNCGQLSHAQRNELKVIIKNAWQFW